MKNKNKLVIVLLPIVIALSMYLVFYDKIICKPNHAGFWFIFILGATIGMAIARLSVKMK